MEPFLFVLFCMALVAIAIATFCAYSLRLLVEQFGQAEQGSLVNTNPSISINRPAEQAAGGFINLGT